MSEAEIIEEEYDEPLLSISERATPNRPRTHWTGAEGMLEGQASVQFYQALLAAQRKIANVIQADAKGQHSSYATLAQALIAIRPALNEHGIIVTQGTGQVRRYGEGAANQWHVIPVYTTLIHAESGEYLTYIVAMPLTKRDAWSVGSAITYGRRYGLLSAAGVASSDDDGKAASEEARLDTDGLSKSAQIVRDKIKDCETEEDLREFHEKNKEGFDGLDKLELNTLRQIYRAHLDAIKQSREPELPLEESDKKKGTAVKEVS